MMTISDGSPAGIALEMTIDLVNQARMSRVEQRTVMDLIFHPDFPHHLRSSPPSSDSVTSPPAPPPDRGVQHR